MIRSLTTSLFLGLMMMSPCCAADWILNPSTYTHDPETGNRVTQYAPGEAAYFYDDPTYVQSGYRHTQTSRRGPGGSQQHLHLTETWGAPVRPYEEWQYPYRPYSTPYQFWGAPYGGLTPHFGPNVPQAHQQNFHQPSGHATHHGHPGHGSSPHGDGTEDHSGSDDDSTDDPAHDHHHHHHHSNAPQVHLYQWQQNAPYRQGYYQRGLYP